ncbi:MAG: amidophosphoribosyltransferase [Prevotella sp.]|nr:amidophosphoribosyltransferase [Prevotella sp.]
MEQLKHECGVAMIRLLKPLEYYEKKYGTWRYGLEKMYLLMEKQHNRGQEGAGVACVNLDAPAGSEYMFRERAEGKDAITEIFNRVGDSFAGQLYMGHLRYSTTGRSGLQYVHPFLRRNNWRAKNLCLCGNFNMTNVDEIFESITATGQHPRIYSDTYIMLELLGHRLDRESERLFNIAVEKGLKGTDITDYIEQNINIVNVLSTATPMFDGGYVLCGITGSGEMFAMRDPWGIRPAFWYKDDELLVVASERPVIQTTFDLPADNIRELNPGEALTVHKDGTTALTTVIEPKGNHACSFERIYFSRGSDCDIYQERKKLGEQLTPAIMKAIDGDVAHSVFSYIPNTAEVAFHGMTEGVRSLDSGIRIEKVVWKDIKLRTFITEGTERNDLAAHVYDVTYGSLHPHEDNLVIIDDSIVRGTTLKESIFKILDRLHPKKIVMVSSSPQIRYPDYYGIDMSHLEELCAFRAAIALIEERGMGQLLDNIYRACKEKPDTENHVRTVYAPFTVDEINRKIVEMLRPEGVNVPIELVYQSIEGLHSACPNHPGDWYFTGHYPTPGGTRMVNRAFIDYMEKRKHSSPNT